MIKIKKIIKSESGFTLIELLVVIGIIAILATIGAVNFSGARAKARDAKRLADINQIHALVEAEAAGSANGLYPASLPATADMTPPRSTDSYCYYSNTAGTVFYLSVEDMEDTTIANPTGEPSTPATTAVASGWNAVDTLGGAACTAGAANIPACTVAGNFVYCKTGTTVL